MSNSKHAFLMVAFNDFDLLKDRIRLLDDPRNTFFLLVDDKAVGFDEQDVRSAVTNSEIVILPRLKIYWAGESQIMASMLLLEAAVNYPEEFLYYHYLMGADLPIKSNKHIHDFCDANYPSEFVEFEKDAYNFSIYKKSYYHFFVENKYFRTNKLFKILNHGLVKLQQALHIKRHEDKKLYAGSGLYSITDKCAKYFVERKDKIFKEYRFTLSCDEVCLQTEIMESPFKDNIYAFEEMMYGNARLIEWNNTNNTNSPTVFTEDHFDQIVNAKEGLLFARKFSEYENKKVIDMVYEYVNELNKKAVEQ